MHVIFWIAWSILNAQQMALWRRDRDGRPAARAWCTTPTPAAQYTSFAFTGHLLEAGIDASIGSVGDAYDKALMEARSGCTRPI
jgi:putative transposase